MAYLLLAALSTPLVLSVHSIVSFDFATSTVPGWHTTIFPPYFVAGAIFGGFAMVMTIMIPARSIYKLHDMITMKHIENMCKIILATGTIVGYAYLMELFVAYYSGGKYEMEAFKLRITGPYWWAYVVMMFCNVVAPQAFWLKACRENLWIVMGICMLVNIGMWFERFVIIVTTLPRMWLPGDWKYYEASPVDVVTFVGTIGMFLTLFLLFLRFLPCINIAEVNALTIVESWRGALSISPGQLMGNRETKIPSQAAMVKNRKCFITRLSKLKQAKRRSRGITSNDRLAFQDLVGVVIDFNLAPERHGVVVLLSRRQKLINTLVRVVGIQIELSATKTPAKRRKCTEKVGVIVG